MKCADDGQYGIHWTCCDSHMQSCEWQVASFKFCPFCGSGRVSKLECRKASTARWAWDHCDGNDVEAESLTYKLCARNSKKHMPAPVAYVTEQLIHWSAPRTREVRTYVPATDLRHFKHLVETRLRDDMDDTSVSMEAWIQLGKGEGRKVLLKNFCYDKAKDLVDKGLAEDRDMAIDVLEEEYWKRTSD